MARQYFLTNPDPDPMTEGFSPTIYLSIMTDDSDYITNMRLPIYRSSDAVITKMVADWNNYIAERAVGSPEPENNYIAVFEEFVQTNYGTATYVVRRKT